MLLARFNRPTASLADFRREFDHAVHNVLDDLDVPFFGQRAFPALNVWEDEQTLRAEAEVPGMSLADLEILVVGNELTIKGRRPVNGDEKQVYHRRERGTGSFTRVLTLPVEINPDKVEATLKDGVLTILLPKAEQAVARKIQVKTA